MALDCAVPKLPIKLGSQERSERILIEATRLFSENGYAGTRMSDIAAAIGVTKPIVYRHFESKQALFEALVQRSWSRKIKEACSVIDAYTGPTRPLLEQLAHNARSALAQPGALAPWRIAIGEADRFPDLGAFLREGFIDPILVSLTGLLQRAINAKELIKADSATLAWLYGSPIVTIAMMMATFGDLDAGLFDSDGFLSAHVEGFWRGWAA
jgi:AcrR family transcriptional regulator